MVKFDLLYSVFKSFYEEGLLDEFVLIGSWCQDLYRERFSNPYQIRCYHNRCQNLLPKVLKKTTVFLNPNSLDQPFSFFSMLFPAQLFFKGKPGYLQNKLLTHSFLKHAFEHLLTYLLSYLYLTFFLTLSPPSSTFSPTFIP